MPRDELVYLEDIVDCCRKIERYIGGLTYEQFCVDEKTIDSVSRNLEIMGEAAKYVAAGTRDRMPTVEWTRMIGLRDVLIHNYPGVDLEVVWDIIINRVPALNSTLENYLRTR